VRGHSEGSGRDLTALERSVFHVCASSRPRHPGAFPGELFLREGLNPVNLYFLPSRAI
jgi:hypothetical protein